MVLAGHSNASYLSETNAHSRAGGHFFMSNNDPIPNKNGSILTISQIIKAVMSSEAEAEIHTLFINCREAIPAQNTLEYLGHKQPPAPLQTDNTTALGVVNNNIMKKLKSMDMKYHWLRYRIIQRWFYLRYLKLMIPTFPSLCPFYTTWKVWFLCVCLSVHMFVCSNLLRYLKCMIPTLKSLCQFPTLHLKDMVFLSGSIGHPPHSLASPVELHLQVL